MIYLLWWSMLRWPRLRGCTWTGWPPPWGWRSAWSGSTPARSPAGSESGSRSASASKTGTSWTPGGSDAIVWTNKVLFRLFRIRSWGWSTSWHQQNSIRDSDKRLTEKNAHTDISLNPNKRLIKMKNEKTMRLHWARYRRRRRRRWRRQWCKISFLVTFPFTSCQSFCFITGRSSLMFSGLGQFSIFNFQWGEKIW